MLLTNGTETDGEVVWSCSPAIFCPWGKFKKRLRVKGFYGLTARAGLLAERRWALLGPRFTSFRLGEN